MLFVCIASFSNAQFNKFDEYKIETFSTKSKIGVPDNNVKFLDDVEFQKVCKQFEKKKIKKLGQTVIGPGNISKEYICTSPKGDSSKMVCFKVFEVDDKKGVVKLEFKIVNAQASKGNGLINEFYYQVKKDYNYVVSLKADKKNSYTFLISPSEMNSLAKK